MSETNSADPVAEATGHDRWTGTGNSPQGSPSRRFEGLSDEELVEALLEGSEAHFNELYHRYFDRIYGYIFRRMRNHSDAEEVVQESFTAVFCSIDRYRGQSSLLAWMYGIARNMANSHVRRLSLGREKVSDYACRQISTPSSLMSCTPEENLQMQRYGDAIKTQLESAGSWQAEIFRMRHMDNLSIGEIATRTNRSNDAVRSSLYRVKQLVLDTMDAGRDSIAGAS